MPIGMLFYFALPKVAESRTAQLELVYYLSGICNIGAVSKQKEIAPFNLVETDLYKCKEKTNYPNHTS